MMSTSDFRCWMTLLHIFISCLIGHGLGNSQQTVPPSAQLAKFFVADLPSPFKMTIDQTDIDLAKQGGFDEFGTLRVDWRCINNWFTLQLTTSSLRTSSINDADFVFVPVDFRRHNSCDPHANNTWEVTPESNLEDFMNKASTLLPLLGKLPHLIILQKNPGRLYASVIRHVNAKFFTFVTSNPYIFNEADFSTTESRIKKTLQEGSDKLNNVNFTVRNSNYNCQNCVGAPYYQMFSWNSSTPEIQRLQLPFDKAVCRDKNMLISQSFAIRGTGHTHVTDWMRVVGKHEEGVHQREVLQYQCAARPENCENLHWYFRRETKLDLRNLSLKSWYSLQPLGDNVIRGAMYESWAAYAIPIVMNEEALWQLPYLDVIDYSNFVAYVPEASFMPSPGLSVNIVDTINSKFEAKKVCAQLEELHRALGIFVYLTDPQHNLIRFDTREKVVMGDDAFTFTMKSVLRKLCRDGMISVSRCGVYL